MHLYRQPVHVTVNEHGCPTAFTWRNRLYRVRHVQKSWAITRQWWRDHDLEPPFDQWLYRVSAISDHGEGVVELKESKGSWTLERFWD